MEDPDRQWELFLAARRADMRIEVVKRAINQGALAGMGSEISDYAAWLVIDALDTFDADAEQRAHAQGLRQGVILEQLRHESRSEDS
jgi:hypothetical protein